MARHFSATDGVLSRFSCVMHDAEAASRCVKSDKIWQPDEIELFIFFWGELLCVAALFELSLLCSSLCVKMENIFKVYFEPFFAPVRCRTQQCCPQSSARIHVSPKMLKLCALCEIINRVCIERERVHIILSTSLTSDGLNVRIQLDKRNAIIVTQFHEGELSFFWATK